jgi:hypothetical protein
VNGDDLAGWIKFATDDASTVIYYFILLDKLL